MSEKNEGPMPWRLQIAAQLMAGCWDADADISDDWHKVKWALVAADDLIDAHKATEAQSDD